MAGHSKFKNIMHRKGAQDARRAKKFARRLSARFNKRTVMIDERLTSHEAKKIRPDEKIDDLAATFILETWLNAPSSASDP